MTDPDIRNEDMEVEHRPHKKLDVRNISHNANFCCKKFKFGLVHKEEKTTHSTDALESIKHKHEEVKKILLSGLKTMHQKGTRILLFVV